MRVLLCFIVSLKLLALDYSLKQDEEFQYLELSGVIGLSGARSFQDESQVLDEVKLYLDSQRALLIKLDSLGGYTNQYQAMKDFIDYARKLKNDQVYTVIEKDKQCASMCVIYFLLCPNRLIHSDAEIGLHSASFNGVSTDIVTKEYLEWMVELGVSKAWIRTNRKVFEKQDFDWYSPHQLALEESGIVTFDQIL